MQEIWKDINDYEGLYQVSNLGRVKSLSRKYKKRVIQEHIVQPSIAHNGYLRVGLSKNGIRKYDSIHRLVAKAFIPNPNNYNIVNHKDCNRQNNCVDNLEWCNEKYNINYKNTIAKGHITWVCNYLEKK